MKQLLVDYLPFEVKPEQITESMKENDGKLVVRGVLQRAESKNQNGRVYPFPVLQREVKNYTKKFEGRYNDLAPSQIPYFCYNFIFIII